MSIISLLNYLKNAYTSIDLALKNPLSHSIRRSAKIKSRTINYVENIMKVCNILQTMYEDKDPHVTSYYNMEDLAQKLKVLVIDLLDSDFDNNFVKNMRLKLNDYIHIHPDLLVTYAQSKLDKAMTGPGITSDKMEELEKAVDLARYAAILRQRINTTWGLMDAALDDVDNRVDEETIKTNIAEAAYILHKFDDAHARAGKISKKIHKKNIRNTKRRRKYKRNKSRRSTH